ncbi:MAG: Rrf2 family transcriptional regulator [Rubellimicrobium sp.]|nr:Rrf2 family transcriptional regulator [Rubellimicrobium sp.]
MRLTVFSDYALRVLMFAHAAEGRLVKIEETARAYSISRAHLMKVVNILTREGFLRGVRGRAGGFTLGLPADQINLGAVLRATEPDFALVECFSPDNRCVVARFCGLPDVLNQAMRAFIEVLDRHTLADLGRLPAGFDPLPAQPLPALGPDIAPAPRTESAA